MSQEVNLERFSLDSSRVRVLSPRSHIRIRVFYVCVCSPCVSTCTPTRGLLPLARDCPVVTTYELVFRSRNRSNPFPKFARRVCNNTGELMPLGRTVTNGRVVGFHELSISLFFFFFRFSTRCFDRFFRLISDVVPLSPPRRGTTTHATQLSLSP